MSTSPYLRAAEVFEQVISAPDGAALESAETMSECIEADSHATGLLLGAFSGALRDTLASLGFDDDERKAYASSFADHIRIFALDPERNADGDAA